MKHELRLVVRETVKDGAQGYETKIEGEGVNADMMVEAIEHLTECFVNNFVESEEK